MELRIDQFAYMITAAHPIYSPGLDDIPRWLFLSNCSYEFAHVVARILNLSFSCSTVPLQWPQAVVTSVPKVAKPWTLSEI